MPKEHKMMQVTNRISNLSYLQNNSIKAVSEKGPPTPTDCEKIGFGTGLLAYLTGGLTNTGIAKAYDKTVGTTIVKQLTKTAKSEKDLGEILEKTLEKSGLAAKGVQIIDISKMQDIEITTPNGEKILKSVNNQISELFIKELENNPITKPLFKNLTQNPNIKEGLHSVFDQKLAPIFSKGNNAACLFSTNKILLDSKKIGYAGFHEIGHAMNRNLSKTGKILQNMRGLKLLTPVLLMTALLTNKRTAENPPQTKWQKTKNFIKENVGKLTALLCMPIFVEEIMASVKGQKLAKSILPKNLIKNVTKTHILSAASYLCFMIVTGFAAFAANKVRDKIAH